MAADSRPIRASRALMAAYLDNRLAHPDKHILRMLIVVPYERTYSAAVAPTGHAGPAAPAAEREDSTMKMKHFAIITTILAAVVASGQADARLVSTRAQCVAACGNATTETCSWITKRGKFNRCRAKLINQCKRFGTDLMCPPPAAPPAPPVTTTTTTVPYIPPTTTTTLPTRGQFYEGTWQFTGSVSENSCGLSVAGLSDAVTVDVQIGGGITGTVASVPGVVFVGSFPFDDPDDLGLAASFSYQGCAVTAAMLFDYAPSTVLYGAWGNDLTCGTVTCRVIWTGNWRRLS